MEVQSGESGKRPMADGTGESPDAKRLVISGSPDVDEALARFSDTVDLPEDNAPNHIWFKFILAKVDELQKSVGFQYRELSEIKDELKQVKHDVVDLRDRVTVLENENISLKSQNQELQEQSLLSEVRRRELNLVFEGIKDTYDENAGFLHRKLVDVLNHMEVFNNCGARVPITRIQRIGPGQRGQCRPALISFLRYDDVQLILRNRGQLPNNVFVREDYPMEIEERRRVLRPIFNKARKSDKYRGRCRLTVDKLVILGHTYTVRPVNNLDKLPQDLNPRKMAEREDDNTLAFFTQGSPFSNFHGRSFMKDNVKYLCSEQYIQAKKAQIFNDDATHYRIMQASSPYEMKRLGNHVSNFVGQVWTKEAEKVALDACFAKFSQNEDLKDILLKTQNKTLAEASPDQHWGVGLTLSDENLLSGAWTGNNLLGKVLMNVREQLKNT